MKKKCFFYQATIKVLKIFYFFSFKNKKTITLYYRNKKISMLFIKGDVIDPINRVNKYYFIYTILIGRLKKKYSTDF